MEWWLALAGTLVGGLLSMFGSYAAWRRESRERAEQQSRTEIIPLAGRLLTATWDAWDEQAAFRSLTERLGQRSIQLSVASADWDRVDADREMTLRQHDDAVRGCRKVAAELTLVCPDVAKAADRLVQAVWLFGRHYPLRLPGRPTPEEVTEHEVARQEFIAATRKTVYGTDR